MVDPWCTVLMTTPVFDANQLDSHFVRSLH